MSHFIDPLNSDKESPDRRLIAAARAQAARAVATAASTDKSIDFDPGTKSAPIDGDSEETPSTPFFSPIPGYEMIEELQRGGQGVVYKAIQRTTQRVVAIKVMKEGPFASTVERARFDREIQILGQLRHPNIVDIRGAGMTAGAQYFVMDYVEGRPIDAHVLESDLDSRSILSLFAIICDAVHTAHLLGIVHRDLKPSNVRVEQEGKPHILDFGLAKRSHEDESRHITTTGQFIGTLPWVAPEQTEANPAKIDARTDVYSIGVMLYHSLARSFPYDVTGSLSDVLKRIAEDEPARLHSKRSEINDEIETIVLKCLQKDRDRRYRTAGALARDLRQYLAGEPIDAKRDSTIYVLRKQLRKHRLPVMVAFVISITIAIGFMVSTAGWRSAALERDAAIEARHEAEALYEFLSDTFSSVNPSLGRRSDVTVREMLDEAAAKIGDSFTREPLTEASLRTTIGLGYNALGHYATAEDHFRRALALREAHLPADDILVAESLHHVGMSLITRTSTDEAEQLHLRALEIFVETYGEERSETAGILHGLACLYRSRRDFKQSETYFQRALAIFRNSNQPRSLAAILKEHASLETLQGNYDAAETKLMEAIEILREVVGEGHADFADLQNSLAGLYVRQGDFSAAEPIARHALATNLKMRGEESPSTSLSMNTLAMILTEQKRFDDAEALWRKSTEMRRNFFGAEHAFVASNLGNLAQVLVKKNDVQGALTVFQESLDMFRRVDERKLDYSNVLINCGKFYNGLERYIDAEGLYREAVEVRTSLFGADHINLSYPLEGLAQALLGQGRYEEAEPLFQEVLDLHEGSNHEVVALAKSGLGECLTQRGLLQDGETLLTEGFEGLKSLRGTEDALTQRALQRLIQFYELVGRLDEADKYREVLNFE